MRLGGYLLEIWVFTCLYVFTWWQVVVLALCASLAGRVKTNWRYRDARALMVRDRKNILYAL